MKIYELKAIMPDGKIKDYTAKAKDLFKAQNGIAKAFKEQFPVDWKTSVKWEVYRARLV